jgi:hypothetical protein
MSVYCRAERAAPAVVLDETTRLTNTGLAGSPSAGSMTAT